MQPFDYLSVSRFAFANPTLPFPTLSRARFGFVRNIT